MKREKIDRLLSSNARQAAEEFLQEVDEAPGSDDFDLHEALDINLAEALSHFNSDAALTRHLSLRLVGENVEGRLPERAVEDILAAFRKELAGAAPGSAKEDLKLDMVGFSRGSAIIHLEPALGEDAFGDEDGEETAQPSLVAAPDRYDAALKLIVDLHRAAEFGQDMRRFRDYGDLVSALEKLANALEKHRVDLDVHWRSGSGLHRRSTLTEVGRSHFRSYLTAHDVEEERTLQGRIVALDLSGSFSLKTGYSRNSKKYEINTDGEDALLSLNLQLGSSVTAIVSRRWKETHLGTVLREQYRLVGLTNGEPTIGDLEEPD